MDWKSLTTPQTAIATLLLTTSILLSHRLYKTRLRRIPTTAYLKPSHFNDLSASASSPSNANAAHSKAAKSSPKPYLPIRSSLLGVCTSTHDPDNFRFYHTPLGRLALWGTALRPIPERRALKDQTLSVRLAGIDAPELAHFGKPAQPYAEEALVALKGLIEGRRVRVWLLRRDQYGRVVGLAFVRRSSWDLLRGVRDEGLWRFWRMDVGLEMLRRGCATVYEGTYGAEYGGWERERRYREAEGEAKRAGLGMWKGTKGSGGHGTGQGRGKWGSILGWIGIGKKKEKLVAFESPREYKQRMAKMEEEEAAERKRQKKDA